MESAPKKKDEEVKEPASVNARDGRRFRLMKEALDKAVKKITKSASLSVFAKSYPTVSKQNMKALQCIQEQYKKHLKMLINDELEAIFQEELMPEFLLELDSLVDNAARDRSQAAWRPSGQPDEDICRHLCPLQMKQKEHLEKILASAEKEYNTLKSTCLSSRQSLKVKVEKCEKLVKEAQDDISVDEELAFIEAVKVSSNE